MRPTAVSSSSAVALSHHCQPCFSYYCLNIFCSYQDKCAAMSFLVLPLISFHVPSLERSLFACEPAVKQLAAWVTMWKFIFFFHPNFLFQDWKKNQIKVAFPLFFFFFLASPVPSCLLGFGRNWSTVHIDWGEVL